MQELSVHSPLGPLTLTEQDGAIVALGWGWAREAEETGLLRLAREQLGEYFDGARSDFNLPLEPSGTPFQRSVWSHLLEIPYGGTESYGSVARSIGTAARAIGGACARTPIPILIPCHRVLGSNGAVGGYSGGDGIESKHYLLRLEGAQPH